ncbi:hypothetical protein DMH04_01380 [Kibdelosporangium aridum]|uniref:Uncharacterized protein n=1 Tax=Kibdelosporangium aridum TaxID=2030 RepID=A0A428ZUC9_KIBAR|nr:hypothetical protein [Kibdelosporangium aridum]RSM91658.1 hypothetical protein DMH04_01380 [Kibdelosporangium aridum]
MGMFSYVNVRHAECPTCHALSDQHVQFYFGGCALETLEIGDSLRWGAYDRGMPGHRLVVTDGIGEGCPHCGGPEIRPNLWDADLFDIFIEHDVITYARWATGEFDYRNDGVPDADADYIVLDSYPPSLRR